MRNGNANPGISTVPERHRRTNRTIKAVKVEKREVYCPHSNVQLYPFDTAYVQRLKDGDLATQRHFYGYFSKILQIKARSRQVPTTEIGWIINETFLRVLMAVRDGTIHRPECLGAFVNSTCRNVLNEYYRDRQREQHVDLDAVEIPDWKDNPQGSMEAQEKDNSVRAALNGLDKRDREILYALFFEERDKDDVCREFKVTREYLRVLLYRAKGSFRSHYKPKKFPFSFGKTMGN